MKRDEKKKNILTMIDEGFFFFTFRGLTSMFNILKSRVWQPTRILLKLQHTKLDLKIKIQCK